MRIASTLGHLPHLRTLSLSPLRSSNHPSDAAPALYPVELLQALSLTNLHHFGIHEAPTEALVDVLPTAIRSLSFVPSLEKGPSRFDNDPIMTSPTHDDRVQLLVAAKGRLGDLCNVSLARGEDLARFFDGISMAREEGPMTRHEARIREEGWQLKREKDAASAGFNLQRRYSVRDGPYDTKYTLQKKD